MKRRHHYLTDALLIVLGLFCLVPLVYMLLMSVQDTYSQFDLHLDLENLTVKHYVDLFQNPKMLRYLINSIIYACGGVLITVAYSLLAGYAFAKLEFKGRDLIFFLLTLTMFLPEAAVVVPRYLVVKNMHLLNTFWALILPVPKIFSAFIIRQAILGVPKELLESARLDGCGNFKILQRVVVPLISSAVITVVILTFLSTWNGFLWPLIVSIKGDAVRTLPVGMSMMKAQYDNNEGALMASATLSFLPPFVFYVLMQKRFSASVAITGIKG